MKAPLIRRVAARVRPTPPRPHDVTLFISTGRCGTQWLADALARVYDDVAAVAHEPVGARYRPNQFLRRWDADVEILAIPDVAAHINDVDVKLLQRDYIETGWTSYAAIPMFLRRYPGRVRLVHLVRHPVPTAVSYMTHQLFNPEKRRDEFSELGVVTPFSPGVGPSDYADGWASMSEYERCLFWWTEINAYALEVAERFPDVAMTRVRTEDLFAADGAALARLVEFLGLPPREGLVEARSRRVDRFRFKGDEDFDWRVISRHPQTLRLMEAYGYSLDEVSEDELRASYQSRAETRPWVPGG